MSFSEVLIQVDLGEPNSELLIAEYNKLERIYDEQGEDHGHTIVAQIFASKMGPPHYFLSGRVLTPDESKAFAEILRRSKRENG